VEKTPWFFYGKMMRMYPAFFEKFDIEHMEMQNGMRYNRTKAHGGIF